MVPEIGAGSKPERQNLLEAQVLGTSAANSVQSR